MPSALAFYGAIITRFGLTIQEAYRYGEAALALQQTIDINAACPYVTVGRSTCVSVLIVPLVQ